MLIQPGSRLFMYSVTRDLGFAPNPFHGVCTLATCKPAVRSAAKVGDWVVGIAGANLKKYKGRCIYAMEVTEKLSFQQYWDDQKYSLKRPVRNGSMVQVLGDNIYHKDRHGAWLQEDSHHSNPDGTVNSDNLNRDTGKAQSVLVSNNFIYFGLSAIPVDIERVGYRKVRAHRNIDIDSSPAARKMLESIFSRHKWAKNLVLDDPINFNLFGTRVDQKTAKYSS